MRKPLRDVWDAGFPSHLRREQKVLLNCSLKVVQKDPLDTIYPLDLKNPQTGARLTWKAFKTTSTKDATENQVRQGYRKVPHIH
jgi:hypothetical protein